MCNITEFDIQVNIEKVFNIIECKKGSRIYVTAEKIYNKMLKKSYELIKPTVIFKVKKNDLKYTCNKICGFSNVIFCLITLGNDISLEVSKNFKKSNYLEALILDTIADQMIYNLTEQLYDKIYKYAKELGFGLSPRMSPGDEDISIEMQKEILLNVLETEKIEVSITDGYMLKPVKSLAYFYGADKNIPLSKLDHDCSKCKKINCKYKNDEDVNIEILSGSEKKLIKGSTKKSLLRNLIENGICIDSLCGGNCTCGKCKIQIIKGCKDATQEEKLKLTEVELKNNIRLACCIYAKENLIIKICNNHNKNFKILSDYKNRDKISKPIIEIISIDSIEGELKDQRSLTNKIKDKILKTLYFSLKSLKKIATLANSNYLYDDYFSLYGKSKFNLIIYDDEVIDVCNIDDTMVFSIAVDIGTTTIVISLIDLIHCITIQSYTLLNSQRQYGADVISRIQFSIINDSKVLTKCIKDDILKGIEKICKLTKVKFRNIYNITIAGNTTMLYFLLDIPTQSIGESPFTTTTTSLLKYTFNEIFDNNLIECKIVILPSISAYVGADIVAGMLNCCFDDLKGITMLIDIGTNGEMAIGDKEKIYCAATAAGPAFEGANIKDGIGSVDGAICSIDIEDGNILYKTINEMEPIGLCGTGVIDIVCAGLKNGLISRTGKLNDKYKERCIEIYRKESKRICFYQKDIREFQLAKSAIRSGLEMLINKFGCSYENIETVYIAGGFGNNLNLNRAKEIGLIPKELNNKIRLVGNSSLGGVVNFILNKNAKENINTILNKTRYIELSTEKEFNKVFIKNLDFNNFK